MLETMLVTFRVLIHPDFNTTGHKRPGQIQYITDFLNLVYCQLNYYLLTHGSSD